MLQIVLLLGSKPGNNINIVIDNEVVVIVVASTDCLKLLVVSMDRQLRFHHHISIIDKKSSQHLGVLMRLRNLLPTGSRLQLFKAAILPFLTYSHLVRHFCRASESRKLERVQERALRAIYCDRSSSYEKLLNMPAYPA